MEQWKDIEGLEGYFQVSNKGNVRGLDRIVNRGKFKMKIKGRPIKLYKTKCGRMIADLYKDGKRFSCKVHRIEFKAFKGYLPKEVDHKDRNPSNNNLDNLRECTMTQNLGNMKKKSNNTSGYRGVHYYKNRKKYSATITKEGRSYNLGYFTDIKEAARAYDKKAKELYGEFAYQNLT